MTFTDRFYRNGTMHQLGQGEPDDRAIALVMCAHLIFSLPKKDRGKAITLDAKFNRDRYTSTCTYLFPVK